MIVVDTSALFAILTNEADAIELLKAISDDDAPRISALTLYEAMIVCFARGRDLLLDDPRQLLIAGGIETVSFDQNAADAALAAYRQYGKGHNPARLNLVDCAAYSLAVALGCPLLFKGDDFARTGIAAAIPAPSSGSGSSSRPNPRP